jgi:2-keto-4-pentenoate hydratase
MTINPLLLEVDPRLKHAADALWSAWSSRTLTAPVRELMDGMVDVRLAYVIQEINTKRSLEKGRKLVGRKIGLTFVGYAGEAQGSRAELRDAFCRSS